MRNEIPATPIHSVKQLGEMIRKRRKLHKITIQQMADHMGVSPRFIGELERGRESVSAKTLLIALNLVGIDIEAKPRS